MPKVTIDGQEYEVAAGKTILQAAQDVGKEIPHYCYHPGLSIAGNCRMCLVEVEKAPKLLIGCQTTVNDGMVVQTASDRVKEARAAVMEFFLINHPLDCPICDQAGECRLQEYAVDHGAGVSRFTESKLALSKAIDIGPHVALDQERCIQCSRCVRFCDEVTRTSELAFFQRGERSQIGIFPGKRLDNPYSGNVVDLCPVGALTLKEFRFQTRVWFLQNTPSICAGCNRGCNVVVATGKQQALWTTRGQFDDRIKRIVPRFNEEVNGHWMCDAGRLSYQRLEAASRLTGSWTDAGVEVGWDEAVIQAAEVLKAAGEAGTAGAILSPRMTTEGLFAFKRLFDGLGGVQAGVRQLVRGEDDDILLRADKGANSRGAAWVFGEPATERAVLDAVEQGKIDTLIVAGDPLDPDDTAPVSEAVRSKLKHLIYIGPFDDAAAAGATIRLPACAWAEEHGSYVNFEGRIQWLRRCHLPRGDARPAWRIAEDLAEAAGQSPWGWTSSGDALAAIAESLSEFEGLNEEGIGLQGATGGTAASAGA